MDKTLVAEDEKILIAASQRGDEQAFARLVTRHKEKAVNLAYAMIGNYEDAKDLSQEAFVKAYLALPRFQMKSKFSTWFYRILMNTAKDFLRKKKGKSFVVNRTEEDASLFDSIPDLSQRPEKLVLNEELSVRMSAAVKGLPEKQRWIFTLRFMEGMPLAEIAETAGVSEGTVKATLHFAVAKFKKEMTPYISKGA